MSKYTLTIEGDFEKGDCWECPISYDTTDIYGDYTMRCPVVDCDDCPLEEVKQGEWIETIERLPEDENAMYWTTHEDGSLVMHGYSKTHGFIYNWEVHDLEKRKRQGGVIAWMPLSLPEPYKKGGAE